MWLSENDSFTVCDLINARVSFKFWYPVILNIIRFSSVGHAKFLPMSMTSRGKTTHVDSGAHRVLIPLPLRGAEKNRFLAAKSIFMVISCSVSFGEGFGADSLIYCIVHIWRILRFVTFYVRNISFSRE